MTYAALAAGTNKYYSQPILISSTTANSVASSVTTVSRTIDATKVGKIAIYSFIKGNTAVPSTTPTAQGWTLISNLGSQFFVWYKIITSVESNAVITWTGATPAAGIINYFDGVSSVSQFDTSATTQTTSASVTVNLPAITTVGANTTIIHLAGKSHTSTISQALTTPSGDTLNVGTNTILTSFSNVNIMSARRYRSTAGLVAATSCSSTSSGTGYGVTIALKSENP